MKDIFCNRDVDKLAIFVDVRLELKDFDILISMVLNSERIDRLRDKSFD